MPQISIIVCTRNRAESLPVWFDSIEQAAAANRAVDVEYGYRRPMDRRTRPLRCFRLGQKSTSVRCRVLLAEQRGLSHARNYGLEQATGK